MRDFKTGKLLPGQKILTAMAGESALALRGQSQTIALYGRPTTAMSGLQTHPIEHWGGQFDPQSFHRGGGGRRVLVEGCRPRKAGGLTRYTKPGPLSHSSADQGRARKVDTSGGRQLRRNHDDRYWNSRFTIDHSIE